MLGLFPGSGTVLGGAEPGQEGPSGLAESASCLGYTLQKTVSGGGAWALRKLQSMKMDTPGGWGAVAGFRSLGHGWGRGKDEELDQDRVLPVWAEDPLGNTTSATREPLSRGRRSTR